MKVTIEFDLDNEHDIELCNRHHAAEKMARLLFNLANNDRIDAYPKISAVDCELINQACLDTGIFFDEIYS